MMPQRNPDATCENCPYWWNETAPGRDAQGRCKRFPAPRIVILGAGQKVEHICTPAHSVCGEHPDFFMEAEE